MKIKLSLYYNIYMNNLKRVFFAKVLHFFHFCIDVFAFSYIFIFPKKYDIYLITFVFFQALHWILLKYECSLSYTEKWLLNKNYKLGDDISYIPHEKIYGNKIFADVKNILLICVLLIVYKRNNGVYLRAILIFELLIILYVLLLKHHRFLQKQKYYY